MDACVGDRSNLCGTGLPALQFDCLSACINQASGALDSEIRAIIAVDREVSHDERSRHAARDCLGVMDYVLIKILLNSHLHGKQK
jgi:hypothetical protein